MMMSTLGYTFNQFLLYIFSNSQQREKEGKREVQKFEYLENGSSFFGKIKCIFHNFLALLWVKYMKNPDKSFQELFFFVS